MVNHPNRNRFTRWLNQRDGLSDDPLRRAAQIALSAIDEIDFSENVATGLDQLLAKLAAAAKAMA